MYIGSVAVVFLLIEVFEMKAGTRQTQRDGTAEQTQAEPATPGSALARF